MTPSSVGDLLTELMVREHEDHRPWGYMRVLDSIDHNLTIKFLKVQNGARTSLQHHAHKDELLYILDDLGGWVEAYDRRYDKAGTLIRIRPGVVHRVTGPLEYLEISSYDAGDDTIRLEDDYERA